MTIQSRKKNRGFTLVELAIVLAVTGVLFMGLYRLLSGGNAQVKDTAVASQQVQVINAVKGYLGSSNGNLYMANYSSTAVPGNFSLPLPPTQNQAPNGTDNLNCYAYMKSVDPTKSGTNPNGYLYTFCDALPAGYWSGTLNAYGQSYTIRVNTGIIPTIVPPPPVGTTPPTTYSFMVMTTGGDVIPDADGGAISSQVGGDGGFIYTGAACTAAASTKTACGTYGGWQVTDVTAAVTAATPGYAFPASASGTVASRTYVSPEVDANQPWLARLFRPGDAAATALTSPTYNTMTTPLYLGGQTLFLAGNNNITSPSTVTTGVIYLQGGSITDSFNTTGGTINVTAPGGSYLSNALPIRANAFLHLDSGCTVDGPNAGFEALNYIAGDSPTNEITNGVNTNTCQSAVQIHGDANVIGMLQATSLYSQGFVYNTSDRRLKKDIQTIPSALDNLMRLNPVSFVFKANGRESMGFIAQELEKIYPQLVTPRDGDAMKSVAYDGLIAPLVRSVQELKQQNDELRQQLQEQKARQDKLEQRLKDKSE